MSSASSWTPGDAAALAESFLRRVWSEPHELGAIDELMTEDYVILSGGQEIRGREQFKAWVAGFQSQLTGAHTAIDETFADSKGERVVSRWTCSGRHNGLFGLPPTGDFVSFTGIAIWRIRDGRLASCHVERAALEALRQLQRS